MSREHVELAKRGVDAFNRRDLDAFAETVTSDHEDVISLRSVCLDVDDASAAAERLAEERG